jgi:hypothetical protein
MHLNYLIFFVLNKGFKNVSKWRKYYNWR